MVKLTQSLSRWLWVNHRDKIALIMLGHTELFTEEMQKEYLEWCKTDEDNLGFTYETLDRYIREGVCEDKNIKEKIDTLHNKNLFKLQLMPTFDPKI